MSTWRSLWETRMASLIQGMQPLSVSIPLINISLQRQLSNCTAVPWSDSGSGTVSACSDPGSCNRYPEFHSQARTCSSSTSTFSTTSEPFMDLTQCQSFPVIVALETSANTGLSSRASALHAILHSKHMSLLNTRYIVSAKASFDYQKKLYGNDVHGYRMQPIQTALLQRWYSLVRERRASRQDFLKALVKVFDVNSSLKSSQVSPRIFVYDRC